MSKVIVYTQAYNAEKTLSRAVDSILAQTYGDFIYYLLDNGSTDKTGDMIKSYAREDKRIVPMFNEQNNLYQDGGLFDFFEYHDDEDLFCMCDADDEYYVDFLEKSLTFMTDHSLDIAVSGSDFIDEDTKKLCGARKLERDMILAEKAAWDELFIHYHQFTRTAWGKLYKLKVLRNWQLCNPNGIWYGFDTLFVQRAFLRADRVGVLAASLHKYYMSSTSVSLKYNKNRILSDSVLDDAARNFLREKVGFASPKNNDFLSKVYFHAIKDTMNVLVNANIDLSEKLEGLRDIFTSEHTKRLIAWEGFQQEKAQMVEQVADWAISQEAVFTGSNTGVTKDILEIYRNFLTLMLEVSEEVQDSKADNI